MKSKRIEGVALISPDGNFSFDSGLPLSEPVLDFETKPHHGTLNIEQNGSALFKPDSKSVSLPPLLDEVLREKNLYIKRSSINFIVQMKFPIVESAADTIDQHSKMWDKVKKTISIERTNIINKLSDKKE